MIAELVLFVIVGVVVVGGVVLCNFTIIVRRLHDDCGDGGVLLRKAAERTRWCG